MFYFSKNSKKNLSTCHYKLQVLFLWVLREMDCTIICGHRGKNAQDVAYKAKASHVIFPFSNHNKVPSLAVDVMPYPIEWENKERNAYFAGLVVAYAKWLGIGVRWGHDWNMDHVPDKRGFVDIPHYEIVIIDDYELLNEQKMEIFL